MAVALPAVGIWTGALDKVPSARSREYAAELEELGYRAVWVPEIAGRDPYVHLSQLLSATRELIGATGIANIWARDAVATSEAANALAEAHPDRVLVGLGVSSPDVVGTLRGHDYARPLTAMRHYLDRLDAAPYTGYRPAEPPSYLLAALRTRMLRLAAERSAGAHTFLVTPEHTARAREIIGDASLLCPEQAVLLETDPTVARELGRGHLSRYLTQPSYRANLAELGFDESDLDGGGSDRLVDALVAWGDVDTVLTRVTAHLDAGADHVALQALPRTPRGVPDDQWRELAGPVAALAGRTRREVTPA